MKWILLYYFIYLQICVRGQNNDSDASAINHHVVPLDSSPSGPINFNNSWYQVLPTGVANNHRNCSNGKFYDGQLNTCRENCTDEDFTYSPVTETCVDNDTFVRILNRKTCKNLTIDSRFFSIDADDKRLSVETSKNTKTFLPDEYVLDNGQVTLCFPYTPHFRSCLLVKLWVYDYELKEDGLTLWNKQAETLLETGDFYINKNENYAGICLDPLLVIPSGTEIIEEYVHLITFIISTVFISLSLIIYGIIYSTLKYHTKIIISHMISLLVFYVASICFINRVAPINVYVCYVYSVIFHFFLLASFFWLNVMSYDIWKHMPKFATKELKTKVAERKRFLVKSLYAWGCPAVVVITAQLMDHFGPFDTVFKAHFRLNCWFSTLESRAVYIHGPAAVLLAINTVFFVLTVVSLRKLGKSAVLVNKKIHKQLFWMYLKLSTVMGLCWIAEIVSSFVERNSIYWIVTDAINGLQGFFLFIIYICTRTVLYDIARFWKKHIGALPCAEKGGCMAIPSRENSSSYSISNDRSSVKSEIPQIENGINPKSITQISSTIL